MLIRLANKMLSVGTGLTDRPKVGHGELSKQIRCLKRFSRILFLHFVKCSLRRKGKMKFASYWS